MSRTLSMIALSVLIASQTVTFSQTKPTTATYITDEEVKAVNATPGVDRTIRVVDIGNEHFAVGIIHRVAAGGAAGRGAGAGTGGGAAAGTDARLLRHRRLVASRQVRRRQERRPGGSHTIRKPKGTSSCRAAGPWLPAAISSTATDPPRTAR
jgi:outer membrane lipoprotein SlyB